MFDANSFKSELQDALKKYGYWYDLETGDVGKVRVSVLEDGGVYIYYGLVQHWFKNRPTHEKVAKKVRKLLKRPPGPPGPMGPACKCFADNKNISK